MRTKLAFAFAVLLFAGLARADQVDTSTGWMTIPAGSTINSITLVPYPDGGEWGNAYVIDYSFAGGTGYTEGNSELGYWGTIDFSSPMYGVSFDWDDASVFFATDNEGEIYGAPDLDESGVGSFSGTDVIQINWQGGDEVGGITSLAYTDPPVSAPEPSSLLLLALGIFALCFIVDRR